MIDAVDPATGHVVAEIPETPPAQLGELVEDARRALAVEAEWRVPAVRAATFGRLGRALLADEEALAELECRDAGTPLSRARMEVTAAARQFAEADRLGGRTRALGPDVHEYTLHEPWGVCGAILSWRRPLYAAARVAAAALAAGNALILKPSELASLSALRLADLAAEAGVPRGLLQVATGAGETGAALAAAADHVTFAGSAATAAGVGEACARRLVPLELALDGPPAAIWFADADLDRAVRAVVDTLLRGAGVRLLVERPLHDAATARVARALAAVTVGPGMDDKQLGPLISERTLARALAALAGAAVVAGGEHAGGLFLRPALVAGAPPEPVCAPVVWATPFDDDSEVAVPAGVAAVWTRDVARAHRVAAAVPARRVLINGGDDDGEPPVYSRVKSVRVAL
jgi:aldehyde dehydrogenase (NAD+)